MEKLIKELLDLMKQPGIDALSKIDTTKLTTLVKLENPNQDMESYRESILKLMMVFFTNDRGFLVNDIQAFKEYFYQEKLSKNRPDWLYEEIYLHLDIHKGKLKFFMDFSEKTSRNLRNEFKKDDGFIAAIVNENQYEELKVRRIFQEEEVIQEMISVVQNQMENIEQGVNLSRPKAVFNVQLKNKVEEIQMKHQKIQKWEKIREKVFGA